MFARALQSAHRMVLLSVLFLTGIVHGVGPDHLAAITAFGATVGRDFRRVVYFAVRFALGHAVVLVVAGLVGYFGQKLLPERVETAFELGAGALLALCGFVLLLALVTGKIRVHEHHHHHDGQVHHHFHLHVASFQKHEHVHGMAAFGIGALFAMGGARSLLTVLPIAFGHTLLESFLRMLAFCVGIVLSMVTYAWITRFALDRASRFVVSEDGHRRLLLGSAYAIALFCIIAGAYTVQGQLHLTL